MFKLVLLVLACGLCVQSLDPELKKKVINKITEAASVCVKEVGAGPNDVRALLNHETPSSHEGKCLLFCLHKRFNVQNEDGTINPDGVLEEFGEVKDDDPKLFNIFVEILNTCKGVDVDSDPCQTASNFNVCAIAESKKQGLTPDLWEM